MAILVHDGLDALRLVVQQEKERRQKEAAGIETAVELSPVPIPDELLQRLSHIFIEDAISILENAHRGAALNAKVESVRSVDLLFQKCIADLFRALDEYQKRCNEPGFFHRANAAAATAVEQQVTKETFAAACAAKSLVDISRRLNHSLRIPGYEERVTAEFRLQGDHNFILELRRFQTHADWIEPGWLLRSEIGSDQMSQFVFHRKDLLRHSWNKLARKFIEAAPATIDVRTLFGSYSERVRSLHDWWMSEIGRSMPTEVTDFRKCKRFVRAQCARQLYKLLLRTLIDNHVDPYSHLHKVLSDTELHQIYEFPHQSPQQVDKIIELLDEEGGCDEEIRLLAFKLFEVKEKA